MNYRNVFLTMAMVIILLVTTQCSSAPTTTAPVEPASPTLASTNTSIPPTNTVVPPTNTPLPPTETPVEPTKTSTPIGTELDGNALVSERCTVCHDASRIQSAKKSSEEWQSTVERMIGKGAVLNEEEKAVIITFLAATYSSGTSSLDGTALVSERCSVCHTLARIQREDKSAAEWQAIVEQMIGNGALLNAEEKQAVIQYLAVTYPEK
jgi:cytochrome c5